MGTTAAPAPGTQTASGPGRGGPASAGTYHAVMTGLAPLTAESAAVIATWIRSRAEAVVAGGPQFPFPLTAEGMLAIAADPAWRVFTLSDGQGQVVATASLFAKEDGLLLRVGRVIVDPARRGEGWGRRVMEELLALTDAEPSVRATELGVFTHNLLARALYERLGYVRSEGSLTVDVEGEQWQTEEFTRPRRDSDTASSG